MDTPIIYIGDRAYISETDSIKGKYVNLNGECYYCIENYDKMPPFFMNLVSSSDHWIFISSTGGLSAGRRNAESALFPYYTVDKITENAANTGHVAILFVQKESKTYRWEPFTQAYEGMYRTHRNLYKNVYGNKLIFEEINSDLGLTYRYSWRTSDKYGLVKTVGIINQAAESCNLSIIDGLQNILPYGATTSLQGTFSNLLNGYKRNELESETGLGIFTLSSTLTDLAEPSESLMATTLWQTGIEQVQYLLSSVQLDKFRRGESISQETDVRGRRGAYLVSAEFKLNAGETREWHIVAEVNQDHSDVVSLINDLKGNRTSLESQLLYDIDKCTMDLMTLVGNADGLQLTGDNLSSAHHFSNILFNIMRGGIFLDNHFINKKDFQDFVRVRNRPVLEANHEFFESVSDSLNITELRSLAEQTRSPDLERLCNEFLPLTFSRRHGDPSRPWNQFSINIKNPDGSSRLDYQGNWRDIFQNWEPLAYAYPGFIEGMISKFLNATTADGYNPYRITADGVEWEVPAPDDPWANIGYWSDHQIIYLQKLLEVSKKFHPGKLSALLDRRIFSHTNVPYRIKPYESLLENWYDTIEFDSELDEAIRLTVEDIGTDGRLILHDVNSVFHVSLAEKLLILLLAKLSNFVPEGGIWMNTQRPEWNDANNALVGKGLSVVTLCYLRRYIGFFRELLSGSALSKITITRELGQFLEAVHDTFKVHQQILTGPANNRQRRLIMDELGRSGSEYRWSIYQDGISGEFKSLDVNSIKNFLDLLLECAEYSIMANKRPDQLFHAYNVLSLQPEHASIRHLYEMLEGQVAVLSSGLLTAEESLQLLQHLRKSRMYRADQHSYMLYPDRDLPGFLNKNIISYEKVKTSKLVARLVQRGNRELILKDRNGYYHFNGSFRNARDVSRILDTLMLEPEYRELIEEERDLILDIFENEFDHNAFTGRSGTFFAYEGLGSIYWHMVSKLLLAAQEVFFQAVEQGAPEKIRKQLAEAYYDIRKGIGFNKPPDVYGAFPTDPYSHTPAGQGAKQPGMTGQVKEECITRISELGVVVDNGQLSFIPVLLRSSEFLSENNSFEYIDINSQKHMIELPAGSLAFTFCQVPIVYQKASKQSVEVVYSDGKTINLKGHTLDNEVSQHIFTRDGIIKQLNVQIDTVLKIK
jgi:hypothetical protein